MKTVSIIKLNAGNDINGNPRRVWVGISPEGNISGAWDEGYEGRHAMPARLRNKSAVEFATTSAEYRAILKKFAK